MSRQECSYDGVGGSAVVSSSHQAVFVSAASMTIDKYR